MTTPAASGPVTAVLIDWAGTITVSNQDLFLGSAEALGLNSEQLAAAGGLFADYFSPGSIFHQAEVGKAEDDDLIDYLNEKCEGLGGLFDPAGPSIFSGADRPDVVELLTDLTDNGIFVLISTNNFRSAQDTLARRYLETGLAHGVANSALMGVRKPDPAFYEMCLEAAGVEPHEAVFVDDQLDNVEAAAALGIHAVQMSDDSADAIAQVRGLVGLT